MRRPAIRFLWMVSSIVWLSLPGCSPRSMADRQGNEAGSQHAGETMAQFPTLSAALDANPGNLAAALTAQGLKPEVDEQGQVTGLRLSHGLGADDAALLSRVATLKSVWVEGNDVSDNSLQFLASLPQVELLHLRSARITDSGLQYCQGLKNLTSLILSETGIEGSGLRHLPSPEKLTWLEMGSSPVTDSGLREVPRFRQLESLGLSRTKVTDLGLEQVAQCKRLERIFLPDTPITDEGIRSLAGLSRLESLDLRETRVTDAVAESLLKFPSLNFLELGMNQISVSTYDRLQEKIADVRHGGLRDLRRTENLLRYFGVDFEVDREQSRLHATIQSGKKDVTWILNIHCTRKYVPDYMQPAHLEGPPIRWTKPWRELAGEEFRISYADEDVYPILPDNPGNIYIGWHAFPNNHRLKFLRRAGNRFTIDWHCEASELSGSGGHAVWLFAEIPFTEARVEGDPEMTEENAKSLLAEHFDAADFEDPPIIFRGDRAAFRFRVRSDPDAGR